MKNILITGPPGSGKTTLVRTIASRLPDLYPAGFYSAEIRRNGARQGFELVSFSNERRILSHTSFTALPRVGKYGVDISGFEEFCANLPLFVPRQHLIIIDEIGKMECMSEKFRQIVVRALESDPVFLGTIAIRGDRFIGDVKRRNDIELVMISQKNRDTIADLIVPGIRAMVAQKGGTANSPDKKNEPA